eukprot:gene5749-9570_t
MSLSKKLKKCTAIVDGILNDKNLYQHQRDALSKILEYYKNPKNKYGLVVLPTGSGKSGIIALSPYILQKKEQIHHDLCFIENETFYEKMGLIKREDVENWCEDGLRIEKSDQIVNIRMHYLIICNAQKFGEKSNIDISKIPKDLFDLIIVDEGHHYPAKTWLSVVEHFNSPILFFTATPYNKGKPIFDKNYWIYHKSYEEINKAGIIRNLEFEEFGNIEDENKEIYIQTFQKIMEVLNRRKNHQAMILMRTTEETEECAWSINTNYMKILALPYYSDSKEENLTKFKNNEIKILVVCGKLLEGFDRKEVSIICILRNIQKESRVLFSQFVGREVRKLSKKDDTTTKVLSHIKFQQKENFKIMKSFNSTQSTLDTYYNSISDVDPEVKAIEDSSKNSNKVKKSILEIDQSETIKKIGDFIIINERPLSKQEEKDYLDWYQSEDLVEYDSW